MQITNISTTLLPQEARETKHLNPGEDLIKRNQTRHFVSFFFLRQTHRTEYVEKTVNMFDFEKPQIDIDSLAVQLSFARQADSLLRMK